MKQFSSAVLIVAAMVLLCGCPSTSPSKHPVESAPVADVSAVTPGEEVDETKTTTEEKTVAAEKESPGSGPLDSLLQATAGIGERKDISPLVKVQHILMAWRQLSPAYKGKMDERAAGRSRAEADERMAECITKLESGEDFHQLMKTYSEDASSLAKGKPYVVTPSAGFVPPFKNVSLRLQKGERALVESVYGWHLIERVE